jgi:hypothetical protein
VKKYKLKHKIPRTKTITIIVQMLLIAYGLAYDMVFDWAVVVKHVHLIYLNNFLNETSTFWLMLLTKLYIIYKFGIARIFSIHTGFEHGFLVCLL